MSSGLGCEIVPFTICLIICRGEGNISNVKATKLLKIGSVREVAF